MNKELEFMPWKRSHQTGGSFFICEWNNDKWTPGIDFEKFLLI